MMGIAATLVIGGMMVMVYLGTFQGLSILAARSLVTSDLRAAIEQLGRDVELTPSASPNGVLTPPLGICGGGGTQSSVRLALVGPLPGVGGAGADCIVYQCQPLPDVEPGPCNNAAANPDPATLGWLERRVYSEAGGDAVEVRTLARGVYSLSFSRNGSPVTRVDVRLGARQRVQGYQATGQLVDVFNLRN